MGTFLVCARIVLAEVAFRPSIFSVLDALKFFLWDVPVWLLIELPLTALFGELE